MTDATSIRAGRAFVELFLKNDKFDRGLFLAQRRLHTFATVSEAVGGRLFRVGGMITGAFAAIAAAAWNPIRAASNMTETVNKFGAVFGESANDIRDWADDLRESVGGRSEREVLDSLAAYKAFFSGLGTEAQKGNGLSKLMQQLTLDFASFFNLSDEEGSSRMLSALSGSSEVMDKFGINLKQAALNAKLLEMGFPAVADGATELQKTLARVEIIRDAMGRQGAIGDAIRTSKEFAAQLKGLRGDIDNMSVAIGRHLIPVVRPWLEGMRDVVGMVQAIVSNNEELIVGLASAITKIGAVGGGMLLLGGGLLLASKLFRTLSHGAVGLRRALAGTSNQTQSVQRAMVQSQQPVRQLSSNLMRVVHANKLFHASGNRTNRILAQIKRQVTPTVWERITIAVNLTRSAIDLWQKVMAKVPSQTQTAANATSRLATVMQRLAQSIRNSNLVPIATVVGATAGVALTRAMYRTARSGMATVVGTIRNTSIRTVSTMTQAGQRAGRAFKTAFQAASRGVGSTFGKVGAATSSGGMLLTLFGSESLAKIGGLLLILPMIASGILSLVSPLMLVSALLAGGVYLWAKMSDTGSAALLKMSNILQPFADTFRTTFSGIADALRGGELKLAGQIGMTGLRLVMLEGMQQMFRSTDSLMGKTVQSLVSQISSGNFAGAWGTALQSMSAMWNLWSVGVVETFASVMRDVVAMWQKTTSAIGRALIDASAEGGIKGRIATLILGVDMQEQKQLAEKLDAERQRLTGLAPDDVVGMARRSVDAQIEQTSKRIQKQLDELEKQANLAAKASVSAATRAVDGAADASSAEIGRLKTLLAELNAQAEEAKRREKERRDRENEMPNMAEAGGVNPVGRSTVTFSAAALQLAGIANNPQRQIVDELRKQREEQRAARKDLREQLEVDRQILRDLQKAFPRFA